MVIRRIWAAALLLLGVIVCLILVDYRSATEHTLANGREIDRQFRLASLAILRFQESRGRVAREEEVDALLDPTSKGRYQIEMTLDTSICDQTSPEYDRLRDSRYILWTWRGEWAECYSPATGISTVVTSAANLTILGSIVRDEAALGVLALLCFGSAVCQWRSGKLTGFG